MKGYWKDVERQRNVMKFPREVTGFGVTKTYYQKLEAAEGGGGGGRGGGRGRGRGRKRRKTSRVKT